MNAEQKRAWFTVVMGALSIAGFLAIWPFTGPMAATAAFLPFGLTGFTPLIGRRERWDERDRSIARRATIAGAMASYMTFILCCMGTWSVVYDWHGKDVVSVHLLPTITCAGGFVLFFARSIAVLVLYRGSTEADNA